MPVIATRPNLATLMGRVRGFWLSLTMAMLCLLVGATAAHAQASGANLMQELTEARTAFVSQNTMLAENEERFPSGSTTGDRMRRETADAALRFAELTEQAFAEGLVPEQATAAAWDDAITARQIASALWLEVGECERAVEELDTLLTMQQTQTRPLVVSAAEQRLAEARACVDAAAGAARELDDGPQGRGGRIAGATLVGTGVGLAGVAIVFESASASAAQRARATRVSEDRSLGRYSDAEQSATNASRNAAIMWTGAAVVAATGVTVWVLSRNKQRDTPPVEASLTPSLSGATMRVTW